MVKRTNRELCGRIGKGLKSCPPKKAPLPHAVTNLNINLNLFTRGTEVECLSLNEQLAGVGGPDDQLVAGEGEQVLKHSGLGCRVSDGKYYVVTA